ncbi:hypothetical protein DE146DRAFT_667644 [Phaeosphaeria sp. MPI-PUGE-AT-0046c]|nr:hypothetical protein DE146DRAFT_667644 [Phaeosphaeria sp. MPI-PUGE-AT-0046c]
MAWYVSISSCLAFATDVIIGCVVRGASMYDLIFKMLKGVIGSESAVPYYTNPPLESRSFVSRGQHNCGRGAITATYCVLSTETIASFLSICLQAICHRMSIYSSGTFGMLLM